MKSIAQPLDTMQRTVWSLCALSVLLLISVSCSSVGSTTTTRLEDVLARENGTQKKVNELNDRLFASASTPSPVQDYIIGDGDLLDIKVFEAEELNTQARVDSSGGITLPLIGVVEVKGLSIRDAEKKIADTYSLRYLQDPHVNIFVSERQSGKITLLGALTTPGTYDYFSQQRVLDVLAMAGGLSEAAGHVVHVRRNSDKADHPNTYIIDLNELITKGKDELNMEIQRGDVIFVPEAGTVYVDGAVRTPGTYPLRRTMTIQEAIVAAGGFASTADKSDIKLIRFTDEGAREIIQLGMQETHGASSNRLEVKDRDIVFVETNELQALLYGLRLSLGMGLVGIGYTPPAR